MPTIPTIPGGGRLPIKCQLQPFLPECRGGTPTAPGGTTPADPAPPEVPTPGSVFCQKNPTALGCLGAGPGLPLPNKCLLQPFLPECRQVPPPGKVPPPEEEEITPENTNAGDCGQANYDADRCSAFCKYNPTNPACMPQLPPPPELPETPPIDFPPPICVKNPHLPICNPRPYGPPYDPPVKAPPVVHDPPRAGGVLRPAPKRAAKRTGRVAVVVDIGEYKFKAIPNMPLARQNADAVVDLLKREFSLGPERILEISNPKLSELVEAFQTRDTPARQLRDLLARFKPAEVIVYITGHGLALNGTDDALLLPVDADPDDILTSSYRLSNLFGALLGLEIRRLQLYLETSFNPVLGAVPGPGFGEPSAVRLVPDLAPKERWRVRQWVTFAAAQGDGPTLDPESGPVSAFTKSVVQGLSGQADLAGNGNKDGQVKAGELIDFARMQVGQAMQPLGGAQTPQLSGLRRQFLHRYRFAAPKAIKTPAGVQPSFNCARAGNKAERAICASPAIATLDNVMVGLYRKAIRVRKKSAQRALIARQKKWLRTRNACGSNIACLAQRYGERIQQLQ